MKLMNLIMNANCFFFSYYSLIQTSFFNQILESNLRKQKNDQRSSLGSLSSSTTNPVAKVDRSSSFKPHKSLMKCQRQVDPKLRIRPFRSKVTFSDDTKGYDNTLRIRTERFNQYNWDSSSESNSSLMKTQEDQQQHHQKQIHPHHQSAKRTDSRLETTVFLPKIETSFSENCKRRQSFDPSLYREKINMTEEVDKDNWLHYQSLPNIQEEDQQQQISEVSATTSEFQPKESKIISTSLEMNYQMPPISMLGKIQQSRNPQYLQSLSAPEQYEGQSIKLRQIPIISTTSVETPPSKKRNFKRQKSQEIADEDLKIRLGQTQSSTTSPGTPSQVIKQSSTDSQASSSSSARGSTQVPPGILRKRKEDQKQTSTESDTGSYHTVKSLVLNTSSSIDSFTSAVSDPMVVSIDVEKKYNSNSMTTTLEPLTPPFTKTEQQNISSFDRIESSLVPTIILSHSTPSMTSQSSDDQGSLKWDDKFPEFSSVETVLENTQISTIARRESDCEKTEEKNVM